VSYKIVNLVNDDASLISRRCWSDPGVYALEKKGIFGRAWLLLGHESQIRNAGDFVQADMCNKPDKSELGLKRVPQVESWRGLIFGSFDADIVSLEDYLEDMRFYLYAFLDRFEGGILMFYRRREKLAVTIGNQ